MNPDFHFPTGQLFECRDCPARCCRMPWIIALTPEEAARFESNEWARARLAEHGAHLRPDKAGKHVLPMREVGRNLQCIFLDEDNLCGLHKRFGHAFIPAICQIFPFKFGRDEQGHVQAQLSQLCPSIRDNYGLPIGPILGDKLAQGGNQFSDMAEAMPLGGGRSLSRNQVAVIAQHWATQLDASPAPLSQVLANLYDELEHLKAALAAGGAARGPVDDAEFETAWRAARDSVQPDALPCGEPAPAIATVLFVLCLSSLTYPARVLRAHRARKPGEPAPSGFESLSMKVRMLFQSGEMDILLIERPFALAKVHRVARILSGDAAAPIRPFLRAVVDRRSLFRPDADLFECLFTLGLAASLVARFARCRAASEGRRAADLQDIREGFSIAELTLLMHARLLSGSTLTHLILRGLATNRLSFRNVLAAES